MLEEMVEVCAGVCDRLHLRVDVAEVVDVLGFAPERWSENVRAVGPLHKTKQETTSERGPVETDGKERPLCVRPPALDAKETSTGK